MLMALVTALRPTIGQTSMIALKTRSATPAARLSTRKRSTRCCISEKTSRALPPHPSTSSQ